MNATGTNATGTNASGTSTAVDGTTPGTGTSTRKSTIVAMLSPANIAASYVWLLLIVIFAIWSPHLFLTVATFRRILDQSAISGIAALAVVVPLAAGVFDLSIGSTIGLSGIVSGWLLAHTGAPPAVAILGGLAAGLVIGAFNSAVVVAMRIDSFIGTLATGSIIAAITLGVSGDQILTVRTAGPFARFAVANWGGFQIPVLYLLLLTLIIGFVLEQTVFGRFTYASGYNPDVTTLAGVSVARIRTIALLTSGLVAALAGVALTATIEAADPSNGPSYLIPAFSAVFLGASQFRHGRVNPWGTVVAVLMLQTGSTGLLLVGAPQWSPQIFSGAVLIAAVGLGIVQAHRRARAQ